MVLNTSYSWKLLRILYLFAIILKNNKHEAALPLFKKVPWQHIIIVFGLKAIIINKHETVYEYKDIEIQ